MNKQKAELEKTIARFKYFSGNLGGSNVSEEQ